MVGGTTKKHNKHRFEVAELFHLRKAHDGDQLLRSIAYEKINTLDLSTVKTETGGAKFDSWIQNTDNWHDVIYTGFADSLHEDLPIGFHNVQVNGQDYVENVKVVHYERDPLTQQLIECYIIRAVLEISGSFVTIIQQYSIADETDKIYAATVQNNALKMWADQSLAAPYQNYLTNFNAAAAGYIPVVIIKSMPGKRDMFESAKDTALRLNMTAEFLDDQTLQSMQKVYKNNDSEISGRPSSQSGESADLEIKKLFQARPENDVETIDAASVNDSILTPQDSMLRYRQQYDWIHDLLRRQCGATLDDDNDSAQKNNIEMSAINQNAYNMLQILKLYLEKSLTSLATLMEKMANTGLKPKVTLSFTPIAQQLIDAMWAVNPAAGGGK